MLVTSKITIDLTRKAFKQYLYATQDDSNTRAVELTLLANGEAWRVPEGTIGAVSFSKPDKTSGLYDTLPDGATKAVTFKDNRVIAIFAPQVLAISGEVDVSVALFDSALNRLGTFPFTIRVEKNPSSGQDISNDYYSFKTLENITQSIGDLNDLKTANKTNLVDAINEVAASGSGGGGNSGGNVDLTGYATEQYVQEYAQPKGNYLTEVPEGYAKTEDVPKNASDIGAQPEGDYALRSEIPSVPVKSVNGKTGAVSLAAADVKARPDNWMPTASDVGALPSSTVIPTVPTKVSAFANDAGYLTEHQDISGLAAKFDPTVYGLPVLELTGEITGISKENAVTLNYVYGENNGSCTLKWQGSSSLAYDKKNYTIKLSNAVEIVEGWGAQTKYCLKANFIDHSHARNIVCAKLWGQIVKSRATTNEKLKDLPNGGAIDGLPVIIMLNGEFHGLYTWNIPKDAWMFGMGSGTKEAIVGADNQAEDTAFKTTTLLDAEGLELEYSSDTFTSEQVKVSINQLINACINTTGSNLDTTIAQYLDWESAVDYFLFVVFLDGGDMTTKNYLLVTFDGIKWIFSAYDMDSVMGLRWDGKYLFGAHEGTKFVSYRDLHRAMELVYRFKTDALKARWKELRGYYLTESRISRLFENFVAAIPSPVYLEDVKKWTAIPCSSVNNVNQILRWVRQRLEYVDAWVDALPAQETPVEPEPAGKGNLVPTAIDTDGNIYNGTGYKDDTRLSSNGSVSSTAQSDTVTIGFVPFSRDTGIIRMKGATFPSISGKHFYIQLYDASKTRVCGISATEWANYGTTNYPGLNISYDEATGITTFDFTACTGSSEWATNVASASYFRLCANGKGADLIVTVNEEIT